MRITRIVIFSLVLSLLMMPARPLFTDTGSPSSAEIEPGGPLAASIVLVNVSNQGSHPRALVRLDLTSDKTDADVTVFENPDIRGAARAIGKASLSKGQPHAMFLERELQEGRENHLFYKVLARGKGGSTIEATVYLRVNLDPSLEPTESGGCLEYQGAPGEEVRP